MTPAFLDLTSTGGTQAVWLGVIVLLWLIGAVVGAIFATLMMIAEHKAKQAAKRRDWRE